MSQADFTIANQGFPSFRTELNSSLQALASNNSGTSAPSTTFANQFFYNTSTNILSIRNEDNDAFIPIALLDQSNDVVTEIQCRGIAFSDGDDAMTIADGGLCTFPADVTGLTFNPTGDTAAGDAAAIGKTAAEGLILTGQGSTNDVTIKNDADADVLKVPTGTTNVEIVGNLTVGGTLSGAGKVLQVVALNDVLTSTNSNATSFTATTLAASITPTATSSKILVTATFSATQDGGSNVQSSVTIFRGSSNLRSSGTPLFMYDHAGGNVGFSGTFMFFDTPNTTGATTYTVHFKVADASSSFRAIAGTDTISLLEIAG